MLMIYYRALVFLLSISFESWPLVQWLANLTDSHMKTGVQTSAADETLFRFLLRHSFSRFILLCSDESGSEREKANSGFYEIERHNPTVQLQDGVELIDSPTSFKMKLPEREQRLWATRVLKTE